MEHQSGEILDGTYELVERIGSGGMSVVWKASRNKDDTTVVIKFPNWDINEKGKVERGFKREQVALERLSDGVSPSSVVQLLDSGEASEQYLVLEYIEGPLLKDVLQDTQVRACRPQARVLGVELCRAVEFLNSRGVVHLDIRPENVLLRDGESPVLIDFNTARTDAAPDTLFDGGRYKPPELLKSGMPDAGVGPWSDIFSLAMVIFYLLSGREPNRPSPSESIAGKANIEQHTDRAEVFGKTLEADPGNRSASTGKLFESLSGWDNAGQYLRLCNETHSFEGCIVLDGDTVGRVEGTPADLVVEDNEQFVSPVQFSIERGGERVRIRDRSLNGTYVRDKEDWVYILSNTGQEQRSKASDISLPEEIQESIQTELPLEIRPVDKKYGIELRLYEGDLNISSA